MLLLGYFFVGVYWKKKQCCIKYWKIQQRTTRMLYLYIGSAKYILLFANSHIRPHTRHKMRRRNNINLILATLLLGRYSVIFAKRPNVVIIFADDVGTGDVPGYWNNSGTLRMPNLEDLLDHGTTFTDAHSTPLCAPSRYVLLSGNYQHRGTKVGGSWSINYEQGNQFRDRQKSIARVLHDNGYATAMFGKWHLGGK